MKPATAAKQDNGLRVNMSRVFNCDAKTLFNAISGGALFEFTGAKPASLKSDFKKGGKLHIEWDGAGPVDGEFIEITPHQRIVFTWNYLSDVTNTFMNTVVTVTIREAGGKATLTLVHDGFADGAQCEDHNDGWSKTFTRLRAALRELVFKLENNKTGLDLSFRHKVTIGAPAARVFKAVLSADELAKFFDVEMKGAFKEGNIVDWQFKGHPLLHLNVHQVVENELLKFQWGSSHVCFTFRAVEPAVTEVTIEATGWEATQAGLDDSYSECEGWKVFLLQLKYHVEGKR